MAQIILIQAYTGTWDEMSVRPPESLLAVAAVPHSKGYSVKIIDQRLSKNFERELDEAVGLHPSRAFARARATDSVAALLDEMRAAHVRFVVVTDDKGKAVALAGQRALMDFIADHFPREVLVQRIGAPPCIYEREGA